MEKRLIVVLVHHETMAEISIHVIAQNEPTAQHTAWTQAYGLLKRRNEWQQSSVEEMK